MSDKANVLEIFRSIQGEGKYAGVPQVFVRFFECNMHCAWCDTPNSIGDGKREFKEYSLDELFNEVSGLFDGCHSVSLTGGEPLFQAEFVNAFAKMCKNAQMTTYLETNGVLPDALRKVIDNIDIIAMDLKLPSSTKCRPFWEEHQKFLNIAKQKETFVKIVVTGDTQEQEIDKAFELLAQEDRNILCYLQPNYFEMKSSPALRSRNILAKKGFIPEGSEINLKNENISEAMKNGVMDKCLAFQKESLGVLNNVRILPQVHKFMKLR